MAIRFSTGLRNKLLDTDSFKGVFANGIIEIYTGAQPASSDNAPGATLLGVATLDAGAFVPGQAANGINWGTAADGVMPKEPTENWKFNGIAAGTAGWFRVKANAVDDDSVSTTLPRCDGSIATAGADLNMSNTAVVVGAPNTIDVLNIRLANA